MFTISCPRAEEVPYTRCEPLENLFVLPYMNCRLVFAELAARAVSDGQFEHVAVDLPFFMAADSLLEIPIDSLPYVSSLVIRASGGEFRVFNFVPNDAACIVLYLIRRLREQGSSLGYECVDDSNVINYPGEVFIEPKLTLPDDYFVLTNGVRSYFSEAFAQLDALEDRMNEERRLHWDYRASVVANRLRKASEKGRKTLFLCNYGLWHAVRKKLDSGIFDTRNMVFPPRLEQQAALVFQNALFLWIKGALDDFPSVVSRFFDRVSAGSLARFDKLDTLNDMILNMGGESHPGEDRSLSMGRLMAFRTYLRRRLAISGRMTPAPPAFLHDAAVSCLGSSGARALLRRLVEYPQPDERFARFLSLTHDTFVSSGQEFGLPDVFDQRFLNRGLTMNIRGSMADCAETEGERERLAAEVQPFLKNSESTALAGHHGVSWALREEYLIHGRANKLLRQMVEEMGREFRSLRSWGSTGDGLDWKATIRARARGEKAFHVRRFRKSGARGSRVDPFTPVAYILDENGTHGELCSIHDSNVSQRQIDLENEHTLAARPSPPDFVYSLFLLRKETRYMCHGHIRREEISAILFLCIEPWMGPERYERLVARPTRFHCRSTPDEDPELKGFSYPERLVACGVKYAEEHVIVSAARSWMPSPRLLNFARERKIEIVRRPLSFFSSELLTGMRYLHLISTPLKKHSDREAILRRYLPDVYEF
jgi:hypothetical protein